MVERRIPDGAKKHGYMTAVHYCLQYPEWQQELRSLPTDAGRAITYDSMPHAKNRISDSTAGIAIRRAELQHKMKVVEDTVRAVAGKGLFSWLMTGVTQEGISYLYQRTLGIPCSRNEYYGLRREIYKEIAKKI
ncbi:MAG: hypothetical protein IJ110_01565 [Lachnospiraceae bacterium]|nr:hypothetical protein [Lachnospiraceae bacterium]